MPGPPRTRHRLRESQTTLFTRCFHVMSIVVMWTVVAVFLFLSTLCKAPTTIPVWRSCKIGSLQCLEAVFFDQRYELIAIFVITFCLFLWILGPKTQRSMEQSHMRQEPDAVSQMRRVVGEEGKQKHVAHVGGGLLTSLSRSEGSLAVQSQKSARPIVKASFSRSTGSLVQQCQEPARSHSRISNLRGVLQAKKLALSHSPERMIPESRSRRPEPSHSQSPEGRLRRQEPATAYSSGTHFYKYVIAHQSVK
jgi:hypothetical protein